MEIKEFQIPVPWGYIAVKTYGEEENSAVLALHGLFDNAGTFDTLIPLLPRSFYYVCIDLPGHGKSSPFPLYTFVMDLNFVFALKLITDYLKRQKYILMGHCRGGHYFLFFSQLYPHLVEKIITLETTYYVVEEDVKTFKNNVIRDFECLINVNTHVINQNMPEYTHQEAITKIIKGNAYGTLTRPSADIMSKRMLIPIGKDRYRFSVDPRLKAIRNFGFDREFALQFLNNTPIAHSCLFVIASNSKSYFKAYADILESIKKRNNKIQLEEVVGGHYVHLNSPENVAPVIEKYLMGVASKL